MLKRATDTYNKVVIAIDDLDKQDSARVRQLLHDAQGMLKGDAWFLLTGHPSGLTQEILIRERGLFDLAIELKQLDPQTTYQMFINYLSSARIEETSVELKSANVVHPFTQETARILGDRSEGVPRWFNPMANYILLKAAELETEKIELDILQQGLEYGRQELRDQGLTAEDY